MAIGQPFLPASASAAAATRFASSSVIGMPWGIGGGGAGGGTDGLSADTG
jgi:hypothetical protein